MILDFQKFNIKNYLDEIAEKTYAELTDSEEEQIIKDIHKRLKINIDDKFNLNISLE